MKYNNLQIPATLVHSIHGKRYKLEGTLVAINEENKTCTMTFGNNKSDKISLNEVYINENFLDDIKEKGQALWGNIKKIVKTVKGFLLPITEKGKELLQYLNTPVNVAAMKLPASVAFCPSMETVMLAEENNIRIRNNNSIASIFSDSEREEGKDAERLISRLMKEYVKPENESLNLKETYKLVCEKYYHETNFSKNMKNNVLNETIASLDNTLADLYGDTLNTKELIHAVRSNILQNFTILPGKGRNETSKPILIWGAPGIGKTTILKKAAEMVVDRYNLNLDLVVMKCAGLKHDDFELPSTGYNLVGQQLAYSIPKTWLPVFDGKDLTPDQLTMVDAYYNSGAYRVISQNINTDTFVDDNNKESKTVDYINGQQKLDTTSIVNNKVLYDQVMKSAKYNGGILFFDEISRLRYDVTDIMMGLMGERTYQHLQLASGWLCIAASNRMSDQNKAEDDRYFREMWEAAKIERYTHYTYVPTFKEWLDWAREVGEDGKQHVDELFVSFIEKYGEAVWYDALTHGSHDDALTDDVKKALDKLKTKAWKDNEERAEIIQTIVTWMQTNPEAMKLVMWTGRTWEEKVNEPMKKVLLGEIFVGHPEMYEACFENTKHTRKTIKGTDETYSVQNLSMAKLEQQLNKVDEDDWYFWADGWIERIDPSRKLVDNNRLQFFMSWVIGDLLPAAMGKESLPTKKFKEYYETTRNINMTDIRYIWTRGCLKLKEQAKDDNISFDNQGLYINTKYSQWKSNPKNILDMINLILDNYLGDWGKENQLLNDIKKEANLNTLLDNLATREEIDEYEKMYTIEFIDGDKSTKDNEIKYQYNCLFNDDLTMEDKQKIVTILKNSELARRFANAAMYIAKISLQTTNTYVNMASNKIISMYTSTYPSLTHETASVYKETGTKLSHITPATYILGNVLSRDIIEYDKN